MICQNDFNYDSKCYFSLKLTLGKLILVQNFFIGHFLLQSGHMYFFFFFFFSTGHSDCDKVFGNYIGY